MSYFLLERKKKIQGQPLLGRRASGEGISSASGSRKSFDKTIPLSSHLCCCAWLPQQQCGCRNHSAPEKRHLHGQEDRQGCRKRAHGRPRRGPHPAQEGVEVPSGSPSCGSCWDVCNAPKGSAAGQVGAHLRKPILNTDSRGLALRCNWLSRCLRCWHPTWVLF